MYNNKTIIHRIETGSEKKIYTAIPVEKPSIAVPDRLTTEKKIGEEKTDKNANKWPPLRKR